MLARRIDEGARHADAMRRLAQLAPQCVCGDPADIAVARELRPGPAFLLVIDDDAFAVENLRVDGGVGAWLAPHVDDAFLHLHHGAFDIAVGRDAPFR